MVKRVLRSLTMLLVVMGLMATFAFSVSADTKVTTGPFTGCTIADNHVVNCPAGYNGLINNYYAANGVPYYLCSDADVRCGGYGAVNSYPYNYGYTINYPYGASSPVQNVVAVYRDNRYCDGIVYITNENGVLINRCDNGQRVFPVYPDYGVVYVNG